MSQPSDTAAEQTTLCSPSLNDNPAAVKKFHLTRYFSVLSFVLIVLAGGALDAFVRQQDEAQLVRMAEDRNVAMTQVFRNALWNDFAPLVQRLATRSPAELLAESEKLGLHPRVVNLMRHSAVIKVKAYNLNGLIVYSSDPKQTGEDKSANPGFLHAAGGQVASDLVHRNNFDAFERAIVDIDLISSYVPLTVEAKVVGVLELYQDVTPFVTQIESGRRVLWLIVSLVLGALYLAQMLVVRRAQAMLSGQAADLEEANRTLENRVQQRTQALEQTMCKLELEIDERRAVQERLDHLAHHDPLTGLPNRLMFHEQLRRSLSQAQRSDSALAILFIDLDRFKDVNDTLGHAIGDELLMAATRRLAANLRGSDTLARLGGDEFVCILENINDPVESRVVAEKLIEVLEAPFEILDHELFVSASIGISVFPSDGDDVDTLLRNADTAMYQAKAHGRACSHFYAPEMTTYAQDRIHLEGMLRRSIENDELAVHYQLKVAAADGLPSGAEALVRWTNPELGVVSPVRFIPIAEDTGFIVELGAWVLRSACRQMAIWHAAGIAVPKMSVNLSVKQLERDDIVTLVSAALEETGVDPSALELEITESVIMAVGDAFSILDKLHALGVQLAVDDFGTGYSSLSYLKLLPIQTLKIDRAFVLGIGQNPGDEAIIRAIQGLAGSLGLATVAEGVDAEHQVSFLRALGCDQIQGYYFGKPQSADEFAAQWSRP